MRYLRAGRHPDWWFVSHQFRHACRIDQWALKPGNVGLHGAGHGKTMEDYRCSASVAAEPISHPSWSIGTRIHRAARATFNAVGCNTNLGVLLLAGPLAEAYYRGKGSGNSLRQSMSKVLSETTCADAEEVYRAIRLMNPAGLGTADEADVHDSPRGTLREMMELAAGRDLVARQFGCNFAQVLEEAAPLWNTLKKRWESPEWATSGVFLSILAHHVDTHIARIHGIKEATRVSGKITSLAEEFCAATAPRKFRQRLLELDVSWKRSGISPGAAADITLCGVFAACLETDAQEPT